VTGSGLSEYFDEAEMAVRGSTCSDRVDEAERGVGRSAEAEPAGWTEEGWVGPASFNMFSKPYSLFLSATGSSVGLGFRFVSVSSFLSNDLPSIGSCSEVCKLLGGTRAGEWLSRNMPEPVSILGRDDSCDWRAEVRMSRSRGRLALESTLGRDDS
jgi:hypothetical protein